MSIKNDIQPGQRYGQWTVLEKVGADSPGKGVRWLCRCACGNESAVIANTLRSGSSKQCTTCGRAVWSTSTITHGASCDGKRKRSFQTWIGMKDRCGNPNAQQYADYGGRGVSVCAAWSSYENFVADMGEPPAGMSIDRIDVNGNYEKSNCRWATRKEQNDNKRNTVRVLCAGTVMTQTDAIRVSGVSAATVGWYKRKGLNSQDAFDRALAIKGL